MTPQQQIEAIATALSHIDPALLRVVAEHIGWQGADEADTVRAHAFTRRGVASNMLVDNLVNRICCRFLLTDRVAVQSALVDVLWATCANNAETSRWRS